MPDDANGMAMVSTDQELRLTIRSDADSVRRALKAVRSCLLLQCLPEDDRGTAEIVLAEALNNIVEHAYAHHPGDIDLTLFRQSRGIGCHITDHGLPMPNGVLPSGQLCPITTCEDLPEGGFGWFLIRSLSHELHYRREGGRNLLSFLLNGEQSKMAGAIVSN